MKKSGLYASISLIALSAVTLSSQVIAVGLENNVAGYLYTSLNGEGANQVIAIARHEDGTLGEQTAYATEAMGGANRAAGGDAAGDFDSQGAIQLIDGNLLVVNAGGDTISVFSVDEETGELSGLRNVGSGGERPASLTYTRKGDSDEYWVVVGNQWNNPNVQKGGPGEGAIEMYPDAAFHAEGGGHEGVLDDRNITLFSFNAAKGELTPEGTLDTYSGTNGGPTTVTFNRDGTKLAVSTWGIAHFGTAVPTEQKPSRVYVYDFDAGSVSNRRHFEQAGISGTIGIDWDRNTDNLFVSNFNLTPELRDHSLTVLTDDGSSVTKIGNFGTGDGDDIDEACWTHINPDGDKLYVSSFGGNLISEFSIDADGNVTQVGDRAETAYVTRAAGTPAGDTKDMFITADGLFMYNLGAYQTFGIAAFNISDSGSLTLADEFKIEAATETGPGAYNFLGLVGFDL